MASTNTTATTRCLVGGEFGLVQYFDTTIPVEDGTGTGTVAPESVWGAWNNLGCQKNTVFSYGRTINEETCTNFCLCSGGNDAEDQPTLSVDLCAFQKDGSLESNLFGVSAFTRTPLYIVDGDDTSGELVITVTDEAHVADCAIGCDPEGYINGQGYKKFIIPVGNVDINGPVSVEWVTSGDPKELIINWIDPVSGAPTPLVFGLDYNFTAIGSIGMIETVPYEIAVANGGTGVQAGDTVTFSYGYTPFTECLEIGGITSLPQVRLRVITDTSQNNISTGKQPLCQVIEMPCATATTVPDLEYFNCDDTDTKKLATAEFQLAKGVKAVKCNAPRIDYYN